jgi:hypothetical protein
VTRPWLIAQNLNSSDPGVAAALSAGDGSWLRGCARRIEEAGLDCIDCNAGTLGAVEAQVLGWMVEQIAPMVKIPLALDSARPEVLVETARRSPRPVLLNSLALDTVWSPELAELLVGTGNSVVLSLRRDGELPADVGTRHDWAMAGVDALVAAGVDHSRILVDAIALPWGDDVDAGRGMLDFVGSWTATRTLVGLGNIGYGHPEAVRIHREWMGRLRDVGISAALVDAFEPGLRDILPAQE